MHMILINYHLKNRCFFLQVLSEILLYTDSEIYIKAIEMRWAFKEGDYSFLNEAYIETIRGNIIANNSFSYNVITVSELDGMIPRQMAFVS